MYLIEWLECLCMCIYSIIYNSSQQWKLYMYLKTKRKTYSYVQTAEAFNWKCSSGKSFSQPLLSMSETLGWPHNTFVWCLWQRDVFIHRNREKKAHNNSTTNINTLKYIGVQCDYSSWHAVRSLGVKTSLLPLSRGRRGKPLPPGRKWSALTGLTPSRSALIKGAPQVL